MPQNFICCDRDQPFLLPPSIRDWLPDDHFAWFVIGAVGRMDLASFYGAYRADGHGRAAYDPSMMVTLLLFAYATGQRSSRAIERHCRQDIAYRVITANVIPDHATVARFVVRHEAALAGLFSEVLGLCAKAGLVKTGVIAIDGTRLAANASPEANREYEQIAIEILAEAIATDAAEDEQHGDARGDELPEQLQSEDGRRAFFEDAEREREEQDADGSEDREPADGSEGESGEERPGKRSNARAGRRGWLREGRQQLERERWADAAPIPRSRPERLAIATQRLEEELDSDRRSNEAYEHYRATARDTLGRGLGAPPKPYTPPPAPEGKVNVTDPDSRQIKTNAGFGWVQGYNAQTVVGEDQIVLAAEITNNSADFGQLEPMVTAAQLELEKAGVTDTPGVAVADAGFWNEDQIDEVVANKHIPVLIPPDAGNRTGPRPGWTGGRYTFMRYVLASEPGHEIYRKRKQMIEPVFGHTKHNRGVRRFHRRGRTAVRTEWRLLMATHNLTKLHRHQIATVRA
jgi:transposase